MKTSLFARASRFVTLALSAVLSAIFMPAPRHLRQLGGVDVGLDDPVKVKELLQKISDDVKAEGAKALKEAEGAGTLSRETKKTVDDLLLKQGELMTRLSDMEKKGVRVLQDPDADSLSAKLAKAAPEIAAFLLERNSKGSVNVPISRKALTNTGVTGTALNYPGEQVLQMPVMPLLRRLTIRDLLAKGRTTKAVIWYPRETGFTNNAAVVSEGSLKPKSDLTFETVMEAVRTIAHLQDISLQMLDDITFIESYIETRMRYGLALVEEAQLLTGSGTGQNVEGIYTAATAYVQPSGVTIVASKETDIDKLRLALLQVELAFATSTGIVLHPTDWAGIELLKDTQDRYIFASPQSIATPRLWGRDVVSTTAMTQGRFLVGDFAMHAQIWDRQDANVAISFENKDNFERNMATIRVEERLALAIYRPEAFVKGVLESAS